MSLRPRPEILEIHAYTPGKSQLPGNRKVIKLSSNEGAFGPPPGVAAAIAARAPDAHRYPDGGAGALREAIGKRFALDPARIVCGSGSDDILFLLCHIYGGPGRDLLMTEHGFSIYEVAGRLAGCEVVKIPERERTTDVDAILAAVTPQTAMVFIANPNNPTGTFIPTDETVRLRKHLPAHVLLVLDAAYAEYVDRPDYDPGAALVDAGDNTVMTRTFSKMFGLGGLRLGWGYGPAGVVENLNRVRGPFNVSIIAHDAGIAALAEPGWLEKSRAHNSAERARLTKSLHDCGFAVTPSEGNFILVDTGSKSNAAAADEALRGASIIVRRVDGYGLPTCLRITIGLTHENDAVIETLRQFAERRG